MKLLKLIDEIEILKVELSSLICSKQYNLTDSEVVRLSELLDQLLYEYYNIK